MMSYNALEGSSENFARSEAKTGTDRGGTGRTEDGREGEGRAKDGYMVTGGELMGR